jgi:hypothetical protein
MATSERDLYLQSISYTPFHCLSSRAFSVIYFGRFRYLGSTASDRADDWTGKDLVGIGRRYHRCTIPTFADSSWGKPKISVKTAGVPVEIRTTHPSARKQHYSTAVTPSCPVHHALETIRVTFSFSFYMIIAIYEQIHIYQQYRENQILCRNYASQNSSLWQDSHNTDLVSFTGRS